MDAVYAFAYAIRSLHSDKCGNTKKACQELESIEAEHLKPYLEKVNFTGNTRSLGSQDPADSFGCTITEYFTSKIQCFI